MQPSVPGGERGTIIARLIVEKKELERQLQAQADRLLKAHVVLEATKAERDKLKQDVRRLQALLDRRTPTPKKG